MADDKKPSIERVMAAALNDLSERWSHGEFQEDDAVILAGALQLLRAYASLHPADFESLPPEGNDG